MTSFNAVIDPSALKELKSITTKLPAMSSRFIKAIDGLARDPFSGKPLHGNKKGCHSLRIGDYRVIYEIHSGDRTIHVIAAGHRKEIYR